MGFVIYITAVVAYEMGSHVDRILGRTPKSPFSLDRSQVLSLISLGLQLCIPLAIFVLFGPSSRAAEALSETTHGGLWRKIELLANAGPYLMPPYNWTLDRPLSIGLPILMILLLAMRKLELPRPMLWPVGAMLLIFFAMPVEWLGGWGGDHRLLPPIGLMLVGSLRPKSERWKGSHGVLALVLVLILMRATSINLEWRRADRESLDYLRSFGVLADGGKMYYAFGHEAGRKRLRPKYFLPALAVRDKKVFVPYLFSSDDIPGIPLQYRPEYVQLQRLSPGPILTSHESPDWSAILSKYDYFLLGDERFFDAPVPSDLVPIFTGNDFRIFRNSKKGAEGKP